MAARDGVLSSKRPLDEATEQGDADRTTKERRLDDPLPPYKMIGVYNYKGGVAKTTSVINIATSLARKGQSVLLIDADPQCNLTSFFLDAEQSFQDEGDEEPDDDVLPVDAKGDQPLESPDVSMDVDDFPLPLTTDFRDILKWINDEKDGPHIRCYPLQASSTSSEPPASANNLSRNLHSALDHIIRGRRHLFESPKLVEDTVQTVQRKFGPNHGEIHIVAGSPKLVEWEASMGSAASFHHEQRLPYLGAFSHFVRRCAAQVRAEFVLVDFGPSSGVITQVMLASCDYILPPSFADYFSLCSAEGFLTTLLPRWLDWHAALMKDQAKLLKKDPYDAEYRFRRTFPLVLPFLVTGFHTNKQRVCRAPSKWIQDLTNLVRGSTVPQAVKDLYVPVRGEMVLSLIPDCGALVEFAHTERIPLLDFTTDILKKYKVPKMGIPENLSKINRLRDRYGGLCALLRLLPFASR